MQRKSMLLIYNPVAGTQEFSAHLPEILHLFTAGGFEVTVYPTAAVRDAYRFTLERAPFFDCLVCSGGDGTLNEVVDALMLLDKKPILGYIPSGTTNDFAFTHDLETDVLLGAKAILNGIPEPLDVGRIEREFFTYVAAFGLFTDVSYETPQSMKNLFGHAAYLLEGVKKLTQIRSLRCRVECDGELIEGDFILGIILNSKSIGGFHLPAEYVPNLSDGKFEVILLRQIQNISELGEVIAMLMGSKRPSRIFEMRSATDIKVLCDEPIGWSVDGEYGGSYAEANTHVYPGAIQILVPSRKGL